MDIKKIGVFITERRKAKDLTQADLAQKLRVTDQAVSKWERGKGIPDASLMMPLCEVLGITVNELLCGETITAPDVKERAEQQIVNLIQERQNNKKKVWLAATVAIIGIAVMLAADLLTDFVTMPWQLEIILVVFGVIIMAACLTVAVLLDVDAGYYECPKCGKTFVPSLKSYILGTHTLTKRKLKCPHCNEISYCKKRLNK